MISSKYLKAIVAVVIGFAMIFTGIFMFVPEVLGIKEQNSITTSFEYETELFNHDKIINLDISIDEDSWDDMLENALSEEYVSCDVTVNGKAFKNVAIRPKGNTSLTSVANDDTTDRYSFKIEFDHYISNQTCYGLDKLILNNNISDATYMKEYLSFGLMEYMSVAAPLHNYVNVTVNGENWGLYLGIEAMEESYAERNFGSNYGKLYKPESVGMGAKEDNNNGSLGNPSGNNKGLPDISENNGGGGVPPDMNSNNGGSGTPPDINGNNGGGGAPPDMDSNNGVGGAPPDMNSNNGGGGAPPDMNSNNGGNGSPPSMNNNNDNQQQSTDNKEGMANNGPGMGGMSSGGTDLVYVDDNSDSYSGIFDNAIFDSNEDDYQRVIKAIKNINEGTNLDKYINIDSVLRYFAVETTLVNLDSYVSSMKHNYCLYEKNGQLTMLPWDYNLSFAGFQAGTATSAINFPIDTPVSGIDLSERPILGKLLEVDEYKETYHEYLKEIVEGYFNSGKFTETIDKVDSMINEYVKNDPTAFYSYDEYTTAVETIKEFGILRAKSIEGQLDGTIPSTTTEQDSNQDKLIDGSSINIQAMGVQGGGEKGQGPQQDEDNNGENTYSNIEYDNSSYESENKNNNNMIGQNPSKDITNGNIGNINGADVSKNWEVSKVSNIDGDSIFQLIFSIGLLIGATVFVTLYKRRR
ncbi:Hypothetical protein CM240_1884 [Clostridium bornimense]|uniref:Spore coat protein CotH n=1 Tax=Clostridium bornimense TaxID=1216932 RepID=W6S3Z3_9CLOT|nr:CotH kinase family protein [Clostridium bornimense]CDM69042.1 Hypothetical protein CM240_1884 [Clostridium bornimense]